MQPTQEPSQYTEAQTRGSMDSALSRSNMDGFQSGGRAWDPLRPDLTELLKSAKQADVQPIYYGSNHTFLVTLDGGEAGISYAVYKPSRGEYPLYDFPTGSLYRREIGSYLVSAVLGWELVPATVRTTGPFGEGSLQIFIESVNSGEILLDDLRRLALLDLILNNADRKGEHCLIGDNEKLWGIDHGLTFHPQPKLRTVLWHFAGSPIPEEDSRGLQTFLGALRGLAGDQVCELRELISAPEWRALVTRVDRLASARTFPD